MSEITISAKFNLKGFEMIDLTNAPEGATHYYETDHGEILFYKLGYDLAIFAVGVGWVDATCSKRWVTDKCNSIPAWSIYSNTKPLSELSDEQRALLFNHWCNGGEIGNINGERLVFPEWNLLRVYKAKQKTERELFVEAALGYHEGDTVGGLTVTMLQRMFDAGFKAPKVGE